MNAVAGLRAASAVPSVRTPEFEASLPEQLVTVQTYVGGRPCASPAAAAAEAGEVLDQLHTASPSGLREFPPAAQLDAAAASARLVAHIAPELRPRIEALLARLETALPGPLQPVAAHGDFNARQLVDRAGGLVVTDFDSMCAAPAALDVATYLAYLIGGDPSDLDHGLAVLETLLEAYGERPEGLSWYLGTMVLRRAPRPFRYQDESWPERVDQMLAAAERVAA
jgi:Ser/Thr protein kinase RdoA (MazF antagonist)